MNLGDRPDEAITTPCERLDPVFATRRLGERAADRRDLNRQIAFFDDHTRPRGIEDAFLADVLVGLLDQRGEDGHPACT